MTTPCSDGRNSLARLTHAGELVRRTTLNLRLAVSAASGFARYEAARTFVSLFE